MLNESTSARTPMLRWERLEARRLLATDLLAPIDTATPLSSNPSELLTVGEYTFFKTDFSTSGGPQLWRTDGSLDGTIPLGYQGSLGNFVELDHKLIFETADAGVWVSDGTPEGTLPISSIQNSSGVDSPTLLEHAGDVYFVRRQGNAVFGLWLTNGTVEGTQLVREFRLNNDYDQPELLGGLGDHFYFTVATRSFRSPKQIALWRTDGTDAGTEVVTSEFNFDVVGPAVEHDGALFFAASLQPTVDQQRIGRELWKTDGTAEGTGVVKDIRPGTAEVADEVTIGSFPHLLTPSDDLLYFVATDGIHGRELWQTDGTEEGTQLVVDIVPGGDGADIEAIAWIEDKLMLSALGDLWRYDAATTELKVVHDFNEGASTFGPRWFTVLDDKLWLSAADALWVSDGTPAGTRLVADVNPEGIDDAPSWLTILGERIVFTARTPDHGNELWITDPVTENTTLIKDVRPEVQSPFLVPAEPVEYGGLLYFRLHDPDHGAELWRSDGTVQGTELVIDIFPGSRGSGPKDFFEFNGLLYFTANDGVHGAELWRTDGSSEGTQLVADIWPGAESATPSEFVLIDGQMYFTATNAASGRELWRTDGTQPPTLVADLIPGRQSANIHEQTVVGERLYFVARDPNNPDREAIQFVSGLNVPVIVEPSTNGRWTTLVSFEDTLIYDEESDRFGFWQTDGTPEGTRRIAATSIPTAVEFAGSLYGFAPGTNRLVRIVPDPTSVDRLADDVEGLLLSANQLFVQSKSTLAVIKGESDEPSTLVDLFPAEIGGIHAHPNGIFLNTHEAGSSGRVVGIWNSDGTPEGTNLLFTSDDHTSIQDVTRVNDALFFIATHREMGMGLWHIPLPSIGDVTQDLVINGSDIDAVFAASRAVSSEDIFDLNADGEVTDDDATYLIESILGSRHGDFDLDGRVDFADFLRLSANFAANDVGWADGDSNGDTEVNFADFLLLSQNFGFERPL